MSQINAAALVWARNGRMAIAVSPLQANDFDDGCLLAGLGSSSFDETAWRDHLDRLAKGTIDGGALLARDPMGRACGLVLYRITVVPDAAPCLEIVRLVAFELMEPRPIADALLAEAFRLARLQGCETVRLIHPLTASETLLPLLGAGIADLHSVF